MAADLISNIKVKVALEAIRNCIHDRCKDLAPEEFMLVIANLLLDISAHVSAGNTGGKPAANSKPL